MEIFNEVTNLILVYHMLTFTDWVGDPETRYTIGYSVMGAVFSNVCAHFYFLIKDTIRKAIISFRKKMW